jgi:hypothetical protein
MLHLFQTRYANRVQIEQLFKRLGLRPAQVMFKIVNGSFRDAGQFDYLHLSQ